MDEQLSISRKINWRGKTLILIIGITLEQGALIYVKVGHIDAGLMGDCFISLTTEDN